ncbi:MAG: hypothetical protein WAN75_23195 [Xanthobacteraceae bacterium]
MTLAEAKRYHAYARECLRLAEAADKADDREKLIKPIPSLDEGSAAGRKACSREQSSQTRRLI